MADPLKQTEKEIPIRADRPILMLWADGLLFLDGTEQQRADALAKALKGNMFGNGLRAAAQPGSLTEPYEKLGS